MHRGNTPIIETTAGPVRGRVVYGGAGGRRLAHFAGVPYAAAARFEAPSPPAPWSQVLLARHPGAAPPQRADDPPVVPGLAPSEMSEDCLTAEIWTPSPDGRRPVIVWVPGGAFRTGSAGLPVYDGHHLSADGGLVVVGVNYRLGTLGFLAADGVPSNLGLRDLLAAIDWVRANALAFGGDPDRIVLMGESAGAGAITHLLTRPDLPVAGAILLSGSAALSLDEPTARLVAARTMELAGVADVEGLRSLSVESILDAQTAAVVDLANSVGSMPMHPWVDGDIVPTAPLAAAASGSLTAIPLVVGTTAHEMDLYRARMPPIPAEYAVPVLQRAGAAYALSADDAASALGACDGDVLTAIGDLTLQLPAHLIAASHRRRGIPVWRTVFGWEAPERRACHALDLPFHFGTLDADGWREFAGADGESAGDADRLSLRLRSAWAAFASTGVPGCDPLDSWPVSDGEHVVWLDHDVSVVPDPAVRRLSTWRSS